MNPLDALEHDLAADEAQPVAFRGCLVGLGLSALCWLGLAVMCTALIGG